MYDKGLTVMEDLSTLIPNEEGDQEVNPCPFSLSERVSRISNEVDSTVLHQVKLKKDSTTFPIEVLKFLQELILLTLGPQSLLKNSQVGKRNPLLNGIKIIGKGVQNTRLRGMNLKRSISNSFVRNVIVKLSRRGLGRCESSKS